MARGRPPTSKIPSSVLARGHTGVFYTPGEEDTWKDRLSKHQIRGWRAVSAEELQGEGSHKRSVFFTDTRIFRDVMPSADALDR